MLMAPLHAGDDAEGLLLGSQFGGLDHHLDARRADGLKLLHEDVLALPNGLGKLDDKPGGVARMTKFTSSRAITFL